MVCAVTPRDKVQALVDALSDVINEHAMGDSGMALEALASMSGTILAVSRADSDLVETWLSLVEATRIEVEATRDQILSTQTKKLLS